VRLPPIPIDFFVAFAAATCPDTVAAGPVLIWILTLLIESLIWILKLKTHIVMPRAVS